MRRINTIQEANDALRELYEFMDYWKTAGVVDLHRRRIGNAHPSVDLYDYVVRKELIDRIGEALVGVNRGPVTRGGTTTGGGTTPPDIPADFEAYDKITFGIGIGRSVEVGSNVTPPYIWTNKSNAKPTLIAVAANTPPVGDDLEIELLHNGTTFVTFTYPAGTTPRTVLHAAITSGPTIRRYDIVTCNVLLTGGTEGGRDVEIVAYCPLL